MLNGDNIATACNISAALTKPGGKAITRVLHAIMNTIWQCRFVPPDWKMGLVVRIWAEKRDRKDCSNYKGITFLSVEGRVVAHLMFMWIRSQLLKLQEPEE